MKKLIQFSFCLAVAMFFVGSIHAQEAKQQTPRDSVVLSSRIFYAINQGERIEPQNYKVITHFLTWARTNEQTPIVITGWADKSGTEAINSALSLRRAQTVSNYLQQNGINPNRISVEGRGVDTAAASDREARRADVRGIVSRETAPQPKKSQSPVVAEQPQPHSEAITEAGNSSNSAEPEQITEMQPPVAPVDQTLHSAAENGMLRWYVGVELGMPFGVSTFSSFGADKTRIGFDAGVYGGYRFNPVLSLEVSAKWGQTALSGQECCIERNYWLGTDGVRYNAPVAGLDGYDYKELKSDVRLQQYGLRLNVNVLGFFERTRHGRWALELSPLLAAVGSKATVKTIADNLNVLQHDTEWHLGAGGNLQVSCEVTPHLNIGIYSGATYLTGQRMDGIPEYRHRNNYVWESGLRLGWRFGKCGATAKTAGANRVETSKK